MRGITTPPEVSPTKWYNTTQSIAKLEMSRTTFWRAVKAGELKGRTRPRDLTPLYQGKELLKFWNQQLKPI